MGKGKGKQVCEYRSNHGRAENITFGGGISGFLDFMD